MSVAAAVINYRDLPRLAPVGSAGGGFTDCGITSSYSVWRPAGLLLLPLSGKKTVVFPPHSVGHPSHINWIICPRSEASTNVKPLSSG